jgi:hypothetical protein
VKLAHISTMYCALISGLATLALVLWAQGVTSLLAVAPTGSEPPDQIGHHLVALSACAPNDLTDHGFPFLGGDSAQVYRR